MFFVSSEKASLLAETVATQRGLASPLEGEFDVYIGIPFCRTRCSYCAFASEALGDGRLVEPYVNALISETEQCGRMADELGLKPRACYVGGGTPTAIPPRSLARVLGAAQAAFPGAIEWTVEAGRPDSINCESLKALADYNIGRISITRRRSATKRSRASAGDTPRRIPSARSISRAKWGLKTSIWT
jgi:oxygen-independent coproporphyrinogen-3 oxidase